MIDFAEAIVGIKYTKSNGQTGREVFSYPQSYWKLDPIYEEWDS